MKSFSNVGYIKPYITDSIVEFLDNNVIGPKIYDYGCGYGGWTKFISDRYAKEMFCDDIDPKAKAYTIELIKDKYKEVDCNTFDTITVFAVLELLTYTDLVSVIKTFKSQLNPGGRLIIMLNAYNILSPYWLYNNIKHKGFNGYLLSHFYRNNISSANFENILEINGLRIKDKIKPRFFSKFNPALNERLGRLPDFMHSLFLYSVEIL